MLFRFDDTNPSKVKYYYSIIIKKQKEKHEFVETIKEDVKKLGVDWAALSYSSDYFDLA